MAAADRTFRELAPFGKDIYLVNLPAGDDPDSFMKREGKEAFSGMVERARSFFEVRIERARESGLLDDAASSAAFAREMTALLACMSDPVARDLATTDIATRMRMAADNLRGAVRMAGRRKGQEQAQSAERKAAAEVPQHPPVKWIAPWPCSVNWPFRIPVPRGLSWTALKNCWSRCGCCRVEAS